MSASNTLLIQYVGKRYYIGDFFIVFFSYSKYSGSYKKSSWKIFYLVVVWKAIRYFLSTIVETKQI